MIFVTVNLCAAGIRWTLQHLGYVPYDQVSFRNSQSLLAIAFYTYLVHDMFSPALSLWATNADWLACRTIVDAHVSPRGALMLAGVLLVAAVSAVLPTIVRLRATGAAKDLETTFWVGVGMVFSYSCWPFR